MTPGLKDETELRVVIAEELCCCAKGCAGY
jgi:hypothetical protein